MKLLGWLQRGKPRLSADQARRLAALPAPAVPDARPLAQQRFVVLDLETSGLNTRSDRVLSIGAVVIEDGAIDLGQQFDCTLQQPDQRVSASVLIHGLGPDALAAGREPVEALLDFMAFVGDSPLLAFHSPFDQAMLTRALKLHLGHRLRHPFFDVAQLAPLLNPQTQRRLGTLDDWTARFGLQAQQRHSASDDALVTAELALILFSQARRQGLDHLGELDRRLSQRRSRLRSHGL